MERRFALKKTVLMAVLALVSAVFLVWGACLCVLAGGAEGAVSPIESVAETSANPIREYTALEMSYPDDFDGIYRGITTANGFKQVISVKGTTESGSYDLFHDEYVFLKNGVEVAGEAVLVDDTDGGSVSLIIFCGSVSLEFSPKITDFDLNVTKISASLKAECGGKISDDHSAYTVLALIDVTYTAEDDSGAEMTGTLRADLLNANLPALSAGSSATIEISLRNNPSVKTTLQATVRSAEMTGLELRVNGRYHKDGFYYKDDNNYDAFIQNMTPEEIFNHLVITAIYENSCVVIEPTYDANGSLDGFTKNGGYEISTGITLPTEDARRTVDISVKGTQFTASLILDFAPKTPIAIVLARTAFTFDGLYPYTDAGILLTDSAYRDFLSSISITYNTGKTEAATANDVQIVGSFVPTAEILSMTIKPPTYSREIYVQVNDTVKSEEITISGIKYSDPVDIGNSISGDFAEQIMHREFNYENLTVAFFYEDENHREYQIETKLTDLFAAGNIEDYVTTVLYDDEGKQDDTIVAVNTQQVSVTFTYNGSSTRAKTGYVSAGTLRVEKEPVSIPAFDTSTEVYRQNLEKSFLPEELVYGKGYLSADGESMNVAIYIDEGCTETADKELVKFDGSSGIVSFWSGGTFYIKAELTKNAEYKFRASEATSSNITVDPADGKYVVYKVQINKGSLALALSADSDTFTYGPAITTSVTVTGTIGGRSYVLTNDESQASDSVLYVPYKLIFCDESTPYGDDYDYSSTGSNVFVPATDLEIAAGEYTVYAVTDTTSAYLASKTRAGNGFGITVNPKELTVSAESEREYDGQAHTDPSVLFNSDPGFVFGHTANNVFTITVGAGANLGETTLFHADTYDVTVSVNAAYSNNYIIKEADEGSDGRTKTVEFTITPKVHDFTITSAGDFTYGSSGSPQFNETWNSSSPLGTLVLMRYYLNDGTLMTGTSFSTWNVGEYYAEYEIQRRSEDYASDYADVDASKLKVTFSIVPKKVNDITLSGWTTDSENAGSLGTYDGTAKNATFADWASTYGTMIDSVTVAGAYSNGSAISSWAYSNGTVSVKEAGSYTVTVILNTNYVWASKAGTGDQTIVFYGVVERAQLVVEWDGGAHSGTPYYVFDDTKTSQQTPDGKAKAGFGDDAYLKLTFEIFDSTGVSVGTTVTDAGTYTIKVSAFADTDGGSRYLNYLPVSATDIDNISIRFVISSQDLSAIVLTDGGNASATIDRDAGEITITYSPDNAYSFTDFIENYAADYGSRIVVTVNGGADGAQVIHNANTYSVTVKPAANYSWADGSSDEVNFTVVVNRMNVTVGWNDSSLSRTYDGGTASNNATASVNGCGSDQVGVSVVYYANASEIGGASTCLPQNANKYYAFVSGLTGSAAGNYRLVANDESGYETYTAEYYVEKQSIAKPTLQNTFTATYAGKQQTTANALFTPNELLGATVTGVIPASWLSGATVSVEGGSLDTATGKFTYTNAGVYSVQFAIKQPANYCWSDEAATEKRNYSADAEYTFTVADFATVNRAERNAPAFGENRAMEQQGTIADLKTFIQTAMSAYGYTYGTEYTLVFGDRNGSGTSAEQAGGTTGNAVRGQYYALVTLNGADRFNYIWSVPYDNADHTGYIGESFVGTPVFRFDYAADGVCVYLYYAITASQVDIDFTIKQIAGSTGNGYVFGDNGYAIGDTVLGDNALGVYSVANSLFTIVISDSDAEEAMNTPVFAFYRSDDLENELTGGALVNGLPWATGDYTVKVTITFDGSDYQEWNKNFEFSVAARSVQIGWEFGGQTYAAGSTIQTVYNGNAQVLTAVVLNTVQKTAGEKETPVPALNIASGALVNVQDGGYAVAVTGFEGEETRYAIGTEDALSVTFVITPKTLTVTVGDVTHVYGDAFGTYDYTLGANEEIYGKDGQVVVLKIKKDNTVYSDTWKTPVGTYALVPELSGEYAANYKLVNPKDGVFTVEQRQVEVVVAEGAAHSTYGELTYAELLSKLNSVTDPVYTVTLLNGTGNAIAQGSTYAQVFSLALAGDTSTLSAKSYTIVGTALDANFDVKFDLADYVIDNATITVVSVTAYSNVYDAASHAYFTFSANAVDGSQVKLYFKLPTEGDEGWVEFTGQTIRDVASTVYNLQLRAENHNPYDMTDAYTVAVTPAELTVSVNFTIYYGEEGPVQKGYQAGAGSLAYLRDRSGVYTVKGFAGSDETAFYNTDDFYGLAGQISYDYVSGKSYSLWDDAGSDYALVAIVSGLSCGNYTFKAESGTLTVQKLPVSVTITGSYSAKYNQADPTPISAVSYDVQTAVLSSYGDGATVAVYSDKSAIVTITTDALTPQTAGVTTNNANKDGYDIVVTLNDAGVGGNYDLVGATEVKYVIEKADNGYSAADYSLFAGATATNADGEISSSAWTYGNYDATDNPNGYNAADGQRLQSIALIYNGNELTATLYRTYNGKKVAIGSALKIPANTSVAEATALLQEWFEGIYAEGEFTATYLQGIFYDVVYSVEYAIAESENYLGFGDAWRFTVGKKALTLTPKTSSDQFTYGLHVTYTTPTAVGLVANGYDAEGNAVVDDVSKVAELKFATSYSVGWEHGSVGEYTLTATAQENGMLTPLYGNYEITVNSSAFEIVAREITIEIVNLTNHFNLWVGTDYQAEDAAQYGYLLKEGTFVYGDTVGDSAIGLVFNLDSEAFASANGFRTNDAGEYPIYLTAGTHYYSNLDGSKANYAITVLQSSENPRYEGEKAIPANALSVGESGIFTITPAELNVTITGPYKDEACRNLYTGTAGSEYDGNKKYFGVTYSTPDNVTVSVDVSYYVAGTDAQGLETYTLLQDGAPKDAGKYQVRATVSDPNFVASMKEHVFTINRRVIGVTLTGNTYNTFNGEKWQNMLTFTLVSGETIGYTVDVEKKLNSNQNIGTADQSAIEAFLSFGAGYNDSVTNTFTYFARNAGVYTITITLTDDCAKNYRLSSDDRNDYTFTMTIMPATLTVETEATSVQYGYELQDDKNFAFVPVYYVNGVPNDTLITAESGYGYFVFRNGQPEFATDYSVATSAWGSKYRLAFNEECLTAYNFTVSIQDNQVDGRLSIVAREIVVQVLGIDDGNTAAQTVYSGTTPAITLTVGNIGQFLKVYEYGFGSTVPSDYASGDELRAVNLRIPESEYHVGKHDVAPSQKTGYDMFRITFVNASGVAITNDFTESNKINLPKFEITKAELQIEVLFKDTGAATGELPFGSSLQLTYGMSEVMFSVRYSLWQNNEGNDGGPYNVLGNFVMGNFTAIGGAANTAYAAWSDNSCNGSVFSVSFSYSGAYSDYEIKIIPATLKITQRQVTAEALAVVYEELSATDYNHGISGAARAVSLVFAGYDIALPADVQVVFDYNAVKYTALNGSALSGAPTAAGTYYATVTLPAAGNFVFAAFDGQNGGVSHKFTHVVNKKAIPLEWQFGTVYLDGSDGSSNTVVNFVDSIMEIVSLNQDSVDISGASFVQKSDGGLVITETPAGAKRIELTVVFNANAQNNYCWEGDEESPRKIISYTVDLIDNSVNLTIQSVGDRVYGTAAEDPTYTITNVQGVTIDGAVVIFTYATPTEQQLAELGGMQGSLAVSAVLSGLSYTSAVPQNAGWYVVRASYVSNGNYGSATAYYLFNIRKAQVSAPEAPSGEFKYTGSMLTVEIAYDTQAVYIGSVSDGISYAAAANGATLRAINAETYLITVALRDSANYEWTDGTNGSVTIQWQIGQSDENVIVWIESDHYTAKNGYTTVYGTACAIGAHATFSPTTMIYFAAKGNYASAQDVPESGWATTVPTYAGTYYVKAVSDGNANYNAATDYRTLTIAKARLTATPSGTITYGQMFSAGTFDIRFEGFAGGDGGSTIQYDSTQIAFKLEDSAYELMILDVVSGGYKLLLETDGGVVLGITSPNYEIVLAENGGVLTVLPKTVTIGIGSLTGVYSEKIDCSDVELSPSRNWDSALDSLSALNITPSTTATEFSGVGVYPITATYTNANYSVEFIYGEYTIVPLKVALVITAGGGEYGSEIKPATVERAYTTNTAVQRDVYNLTFTYSYSGISNSGISVTDPSVCPTEAGTYVVTITGISDGNYALDGVVSTTFEISKKVIDASKLYIAPQYYTESALEPVITDNDYNVDGRTLYVVLPHDTFVNVGFHSVTLEIPEEYFYNYKWLSVDVAQRTVTFEIKKAQNSLTSDGITIYGWTYGKYNPIVNAPSATTQFGNNNIVYMYASSASAPESEWSNMPPYNNNAGTYYVRVTVYGTDNYERFDSAAQEFVIAKVTVSVPVLAVGDENSTYTGSELSVLIDGYDSTRMNLSYDGLSVIGGNYYLKAVNAGTYTASVVLIDSVNYGWSVDAVCDDEGNALLVWTVGRMKIAKPVANSNMLVVNGSILQYFPVGFDSTLMMISGNEAGYGGTFTAFVTLRDTTNYMWEDGTDGALSFEWTIVGSNTLFIAVICSLSAATAVALAVAGVLFMQYRKKKRAEAEGPVPDDDLPNGDGTDGIEKQAGASEEFALSEENHNEGGEQE